MRVTILGCGGSHGVPTIGNHWGACDPDNPRNRRRRASILVQDGDTTLLVDTSPDLREQMLSAGVSRLDAVLYTHEHADHCHGIDDLRGMNSAQGSAIAVYGADHTLTALEQRFSYCFTPVKGEFFYKPALQAHRLNGPVRLGGVPVVPFAQDHGYSTTLGFRFDRFAYSTDVVALDETAFAVLADLDTWVVDCVRLEPHPVHAHLDRVLEWVDRLRPRRTVLTHMNQTLDYETLRRRLPPGIEPAYDGMVLDVPRSTARD